MLFIVFLIMEATNFQLRQQWELWQQQQQLGLWWQQPPPPPPPPSYGSGPPTNQGSDLLPQTIVGNHVGTYPSFTTVKLLKESLSSGKESWNKLPDQSLADLIAQLESRINPNSANYSPFTSPPGTLPEKVPEVIASDVNLYSSLLEGAWLEITRRMQIKPTLQIKIPVNEAKLRELTQQAKADLVEQEELSATIQWKVDLNNPLLFFEATPESPSLTSLAVKCGPKVAIIDLSNPHALQNWIHNEFGLGIVTAEKMFQKNSIIVFTNVTESSMNPYNAPTFNALITYLDTVRLYPAKNYKLVFFSKIPPDIFRFHLRPKIGTQFAGAQYEHVQRILSDPAMCQFLKIDDEILKEIPKLYQQLLSRRRSTVPQVLPGNEGIVQSEISGMQLFSSSSSNLAWVSTTTPVSYMSVLQQFQFNDKTAIVNCGEPNGLQNWHYEAFGLGTTYDPKRAFQKFDTIVLANLDQQSLEKPLEKMYINALIAYCVSNRKKRLIVLGYGSIPPDYMKHLQDESNYHYKIDLPITSVVGRSQQQIGTTAAQPPLGVTAGPYWQSSSQLSLPGTTAVARQSPQSTGTMAAQSPPSVTAAQPPRVSNGFGSPPLTTTGPFQIFYRTLEGKTTQLQVDSTTTLENLLSQMRQKGDTVEGRDLLFQGRQLQPGIALKNYGITPGSTLYLVLEARP